ncbi:MAG: hypothetical protein IJ330_04720 [Oscillospiraceae bacterium]|nr:hypothetical protein [Oscillospiraceae bacterium]
MFNISEIADIVFSILAISIVVIGGLMMFDIPNYFFNKFFNVNKENNTESYYEENENDYETPWEIK